MYVVFFEFVVGVVICLFVFLGVFFNVFYINEKMIDGIVEKVFVRSIWKDVMIIFIVRNIILMDMIEVLVGFVWLFVIFFVFIVVVLYEIEMWWGIFNVFYFIGVIVGSVIVICFFVFFE